MGSHENYKAKSEALIHDLEQKIESTKNMSQKQLMELEKERSLLVEMQQNEKEQATDAISNLQLKISSMEKRLKVNNVLQKNLEKMCKQTVNELHEREGEVKNVRAQMKKEQVQRTKSQPEGIIDSLSRSMTSLLWTNEVDRTKVNLVKPLNAFSLREIRGNRKDGRVRKATNKGSIQALKIVKFDASVLPSQSVLGTFGMFWRSKTEQELEAERVRRVEVQTEAFREAMLLFKLNSEHLLPLQGIVKGTELGEFYMELPYVEFDLDYAIEKRRNGYLEDQSIRSICYQLLLGVYYLHSGNIVHRHLSPATILTNDMQKIFIAGMSFAISIESPPPFPAVPSQHVDCIAPELLFMSSEQQPSTAWKAIDMWAVGTIVAFLLRQQPLFHGTQKEEVLSSILSIVDCSPRPDDEKISKFFPLKKAFSALEKTSRQQSPLQEKFGNHVSTSGIDLCSKLLRFDPSERITAEEALGHPYFQTLKIRSVPAACTVGFECTDEDVPAFVERYCPTAF
eukprot:CAMPEP_0117015646 /NCGR_PEP_ID=MMETSP0472-20121206/12458_1 /TAXON_ID=693140 ORGANISM="Tiarina fusus, Strain LIS" /NCGR_SAMPLE_ID=MMETSP0472 /ASSEMBLY_ACC=CAM_ASM_000603 /LENGTH=510 /DNA_ID=CAMNT_0004719487 /DNA_START=536 /DNA_END=2068 /DNA_ORIENTATION=+